MHASFGRNKSPMSQDTQPSLLSSKNHASHAMSLQPPINSKDQSTLDFDLDESIDRIGHWLPCQNPIKDFIHHNTLHAIQNRSFHQAVSIASRLYGARISLPLSYFQQRHLDGRIHDFAIDLAVIRQSGPDQPPDVTRRAMFDRDDGAHYPPPSIALEGIRQKWMTELGLHLDAQVHPILFRLISNYLDQGISHWPIALPEETLWQCVRRLVEDSFIPLYPLGAPVSRQLLRGDANEAIRWCLDRLIGDETLYGAYLLEMCLAHPGWSGMVRVIEQNPGRLLFGRSITLKDFIAVELLIQQAFLRSRLGDHFPKLSALVKETESDPFISALLAPPCPPHLRAWQEAMEFSLYAELIRAIQDNHIRTDATHPKQVQAIFCIDDRECSIRRHLEEIDPSIETLGAAGFFGIEFFFKGIEDIYPIAQCPATIKPGHLVVEARGEESPLSSNPERKTRSKVPSTLWKSWLFTQTTGLVYAFRLALDVFKPSIDQPSISKPTSPEHSSRLHLFRESEETAPEGLLLGFNRREMADRLETFLRNIGLTGDFADLVMVIAHGASSTNNPHFAAYDCGACSGKPGAPNARAFAQMANDATVRSILKERGIEIPDETLFIAALHDTTRDDITYFDLEQRASPEPLIFGHFKEAMEKALTRNAEERCRWFASAPRNGNPDAALRHVRKRASSIFEPRPELNHSNNLYCIVGPRTLTRNLFLDRRAFLHSYAPEQDAEGEILSRILSQVIPVCGGINLEYYFSTIDNNIYGAGTKLPHNIVGLLGVANGVEGDLQTGLPSQMIEVHEAARLLILVGQSTLILDRAIQRIPSFQEWIDNEWVRLVSMDPETLEARMFSKEGWTPFTIPEEFSIPKTRSSREAYLGKSRTIPVHLIDEGRRWKA